MSKTLYITLKRRWFELSKPGGTKHEEYREIKPYWERRLAKFIGNEPFKVAARNGYAKDSPTFERTCRRIRIGFPNPDWTDNPGVECFVLEYETSLEETTGRLLKFEGHQCSLK